MAAHPVPVYFNRSDTDFVDRYPSGGKKCHLTPQELKDERRVGWELIKQVGTSLLEGRDLIHVSLPVRLFEPRSFLQRQADSWLYAPLYLGNAGRSSDPVERFKLVMAFAVSSLELQVTEKKPFNPILGETLQAHLPDGSQIFMEQTTHHPPASNWELFGPNKEYHYWGTGIWAASCSGNTVKGFQRGPNNVDFPDGQRITFTMPTVLIRGVMWGDRYVEFSGSMTFADEKNKLSCDLVLNPDALGFFKGLFAKAKSHSDTFRGEIMQDGPGGKSSLGLVTGSWLGYLDVNRVRYWDIRDAPKVSGVVPDSCPLPSDSAVREDSKYLKSGDYTRAQEYKTVGEESQRYDRKLRQKAAEQRKKQEKLLKKKQGK